MKTEAQAVILVESEMRQSEELAKSLCFSVGRHPHSTVVRQQLEQELTE